MNRFSPEQFAIRLNSFTADGQRSTQRALEKSALILTNAARVSGRARVRKGKKFKNWWAHYSRDNVNTNSVTIQSRGGFAVLADKGSYKHPSGFNTFGPSYSGTVIHPPIAAQPWFYEGIDAVPDDAIGGAFAYEITRSLNTHF